MSEAMERATRFAVYERARKAGKSPLEAGTISAESTVGLPRSGVGYQVLQQDRAVPERWDTGH